MKRLVVKIGTGNLINESGNLDSSKVSDSVRQVDMLTSQGIEVVLVSSGAIKAGRERMTVIGESPNLSKKEWAGIGARHLLNLWGDAFEAQGLEVAQIWLTYANWEHEGEYQSIKSSILAYLKTSFIPLINENDVVSDKEIVSMEAGISENDRLARMVAEMIEAEGVLFLTDIGGVYDKDPRTDASARKYRSISKEVIKRIIATESKSEHGTGGIGIKLLEALKCFERGMRVSVAGLEKDVVLNFASGKDVGTMIGHVSVI